MFIKGKNILLIILLQAFFFMNAQAQFSIGDALEKFGSENSENKNAAEPTVIEDEKTFMQLVSQMIKQDSVKSTINKSSTSAIPSTFDKVIGLAKTFMGTPYIFGGTTERGFDCSGFLGYVFSWFGIKLPRTSREMAQLGEYVSKDNLRKGDLVFFTGRSISGGVVGHVGLIVEATEQSIKMIHSSTSKGVAIDDLNKSDYFKKRFLMARRIFVKDEENKN